MNKFYFAIAVLAVICSCTKEDGREYIEPFQESVVYVSLNTEESTKASGPAHGVQADDNNIQILEFFIFRDNEGQPDDGVLDGYRKFTAQEIGDLQDLEIQTTTGRKIIYAVANSHRANWAGINTRDVFETQLTNLTDDDVKNFIMTGSTDAELQIATNISFSIKRMVSRVQLNSIKTDFAGGPYEGFQLKGIKAYITNVQGTKYICNGTGHNLSRLNLAKYIAADSDGCTMAGMLYDNIAVDIDDSGYSTPHYFYCYENTITEENDSDRFTRLVIEGELNGITYFYPIPIKGIERNCCYSVDIVIKRPGSLDPDADVEKGVVLADVSVLSWNVIPGTEVEF